MLPLRPALERKNELKRTRMRPRLINFGPERSAQKQCNAADRGLLVGREHASDDRLSYQTPKSAVCGRCEEHPKISQKPDKKSQKQAKNAVAKACTQPGTRSQEHVTISTLPFTNIAKKHSTALSTYVWKLDGRGLDYTIGWSINKVMR